MFSNAPSSYINQRKKRLCSNYIDYVFVGSRHVGNMVKVRRGKKPAAAGFDDADSKELVLKKIRSDAAKVKKTLDTLSCFRHIRPK